MGSNFLWEGGLRSVFVLSPSRPDLSNAVTLTFQGSSVPKLLQFMTLKNALSSVVDHRPVGRDPKKYLLKKLLFSIFILTQSELSIGG